MSLVAPGFLACVLTVYEAVSRFFGAVADPHKLSLLGSFCDYSSNTSARRFFPRANSGAAHTARSNNDYGRGSHSSDSNSG